MKQHQIRSSVVVGGSAGLGLEVAAALLRRGENVTLMGRDASRMEAVLQGFRAQMPECCVVGVVGDATCPEDVDRLFQRHQDAFGNLHALVNVVGRSDRGTLAELDTRHLLELFQTNVVAALLCSQKALPMLRQSRGAIVNVGSLASHVAPAYLGGYVTVKHALAGMSRQLRMECLPDDVHVGLVCPGPILRPDAGTRYQIDPESGIPASVAGPGGGTSLKGIAPEVVAAAVLKCIDRRKIEIVIPRRVNLLLLMDRVWPGLADRFL